MNVHQPTEVALWTERVPLSVSPAPVESFEASAEQPRNRYYRHVNKPTLEIYSPARERNSGIAAVICPGGGYGFLSWDKEGVAVAQWLQVRGITGAVLKYRLPAPGKIPDGHLVSLLDAQRAVRLLRERANDLGIRPDRIGIVGFSAGGHLAACAATMFSKPVPNPVEDVRHASCRPDFCVLAYPVITMEARAHSGSRDNLLGKSARPELLAEFSCEKHVTRETPPTFLVHARDDGGVPVENSQLFADACRQAGVPVELHLYDKGGHGFGLGVNGGEVAQWPERLEKFLDRLR